ncbi:Npun_F0813 family protein [Okeanomitos corallinicola TIOX110]|uniref:Npun_F0813 family protein n=1 Tax=Okeanomitos corallinicola TIOX110 TaxID=3133117 RepID=A0ABZ2UTN5_9CYAN
MFILKRQDVEISTVQHPTRDQQVPILSYQGQTFRLVSVFKASQEVEAKALWRSLTDNRGKACVLLEEPERFSVWGKIRLEQLGTDTGSHSSAEILTLASILLLQAVYMDIEDLLGNRQVKLFEKDITGVLQQKQFPQVSSPESAKALITVEPSQMPKLPTWQETHVIILLEELHKLGKIYFGDTNFAHQLEDRLQDMEDDELLVFLAWLNQSPLGKLWH